MTAAAAKTPVRANKAQALALTFSSFLMSNTEAKVSIAKVAARTFARGLAMQPGLPCL